MGSRTEEASQIIRDNILKLPSFVGRGLKYYAAGRIYTPKPVTLNLGVAGRCNSRCIMCSIWKKSSGQEPTLGEIREILGNPLLNRLQTVALTGGESTLREDLGQVVQTILDTNRGIREIWIITNGLEPSAVRQRVRDILNLTATRRLSGFSVQISLDGFGPTHERIRRVPQAFERVKETIELLKDLQAGSPFGIHLKCVVQKLNVSDLPNISRFARNMEVPIDFAPVAPVLGAEDCFEEQLMPSSDQLCELREFFGDRERHHIRLPTIAFWEDYFRIIAGGRRSIPCALVYHSLTVGAEGDVGICGDRRSAYGNLRDGTVDKIWYSQRAETIRKHMRKHVCPSCATSCNMPFSLSYEFFYFARFLVREESKRLLRRS
jgi:MoaA/NifB/PqqE/SkfB family radical SAM enzyme